MTNKQYTLEEVAKHNTPDDCWLAINDKVSELLFGNGKCYARQLLKVSTGRLIMVNWPMPKGVWLRMHCDGQLIIQHVHG
jgi:hypothetical protein